MAASKNDKRISITAHLHISTYGVEVTPDPSCFSLDTTFKCSIKKHKNIKISYLTFNLAMDEKYQQIYWTSDVCLNKKILPA
jgi:hypothetical protein